MIEDSCIHKIYASGVALEEVNRMEDVALNLKHIDTNSLISCNIRCLKKNINSFSVASLVSGSELICLQETWSKTSDPVLKYFKDRFTHQHSNSIGNGKGIATLYNESFKVEKDISKSLYQMTKLESKSLDVINIYRSQGAPTENFENELLELIDLNRHTIILGDFNLCHQKNPHHRIFQMLRELGFRQQVRYPTHIECGTIDLVFTLSRNKAYLYEIIQQGQHYTDHDLLSIRYTYNLTLK